MYFDARNASPARKKDAAQLNAFWDYRELNKSVEPLQTNYIQPDNDNYGYDPDSVEGDMKKPMRDAEAEWEMRPSPEEMAVLYDVPTVQYKTRQVGFIGPKLSDCGYCRAPTSPLIREIKFPVAGDVEVFGFHRDGAAHNKSLGIKATQKQIDKFVKRQHKNGTKQHNVHIRAWVDHAWKPRILNIGDVDKSRKWAFHRIGDLFFALDRTKEDSTGAITGYTGSNGKLVRVKDEYGSPYGPKSRGSNPDNWKPLWARTSESNVVMLSPAARAKQQANRGKPIPCPPPADEIEAFRRTLEANGKPANDNRHYDGLPYDVDSADELRFGYAFGKTYAVSNNPEPFDDVVERKQLLAAVNSRLSPQTRRVANMVVQTQETETLAQNYADVGAALANGNASERTLIRHGQKAVSDAAKEIGTVHQELAA
jgi:hypothetical protein